jgi:cytosine permease
MTIETDSERHGSSAHEKHQVFADDFAVDRVPMAARLPLGKVLWVQLGIVTAMSQFVLGAALGFGMTFWRAFWALFLGSVLLVFVGVGIGVAGAREGLPTGVLARWCGFGKYGSSLISLLVVVGCTAWFGVQNAIFADAVNQATRGRLSPALASLFTGVLLTVITISGFRWISRTASFTVPAFALVVIYGAWHVLAAHTFGELVAIPPTGQELTLVSGATMVAGGYMLGAVLTADIARFCRSPRDIFWVTLIGQLVGQFGVGMAGVLLAHAARTRDVIRITFGVAGWLGVTVACLATVKLNDMNLYSSSLHLTNLVDALFRRRVNRGLLTLGLGAAGTLFSVLGVLERIVPFLLILGVIVPPVGGVMLADYFFLKRDREELRSTRGTLRLPRSCEWLNPMAVVAWGAGSATGYFLPVGIASLNSIVASGLVYLAGMKTLAALTRRPVVRFSASPES